MVMVVVMSTGGRHALLDGNESAAPPARLFIKPMSQPVHHALHHYLPEARNVTRKTTSP